MAKILAPTASALTAAVDILESGGLIGLPTETVYGLACDATNGDAVAKVFEAKGRPRFNPLISHVPGVEAGERLAHFPPLALKLAEQYWPGPLTMVLPKLARARVHDLVTAGLNTIAVRSPGHAVARQVLMTFRKPIAAPSANPSGRLSPTCAAHVEEGLGNRIELILDGGACAIGLESTVVEVAADKVYLLRYGSISEEDLAETLGRPVLPAEGEIKSPGQLLSHYAPNARVRLDVLEAGSGEKMLGFGAVAGDLNLSPAGHLREAATNLFSMLRQLDAMRPKIIAVAPIPDHGLGRAINDRLARAAAGR